MLSHFAVVHFKYHGNCLKIFWTGRNGIPEEMIGLYTVPIRVVVGAVCLPNYT